MLAAIVLNFGVLGIAHAGPDCTKRVFDSVQDRSTLPKYDHIVIVVEENKDYDQVIDKPSAPYINGTLKAEGATFHCMYGEEHNSQGNYFWLFSGSNQSVGFNDDVPKTLFVNRNLGEQLINKCTPTKPYTECLSFKGYAEDLPNIGSTVEFAQTSSCSQNCTTYARKHVPWISFANVPNGTSKETSSNLRFADFPSKFDDLPTVAIVIPNLQNDMHNGKSIEDEVRNGDAWLSAQLGSYYQWAKSHNSLLIVTFDENDDKGGYVGLTNPAVEPTDEYRENLQNRTITIFAGAHIRGGVYEESINHITILRTIEAMYDLARSGAQQPNAAAAGMSDDQIITDVFSGSQ
jgi:hypothetical protein